MAHEERAVNRGKAFEEDVWGVNEVANDNNGGSSSAWHKSKAPRKIPKANNNVLSSSCAQVLQGSSSSSSSSSEPMDIPDWSKIYGKKKYLNKGLKDGASNNDDDGDDDDGDGDGDDDDDMSIPPHEWLARKLARNQISSSSVCEGIGRTLKGRDLSKVRTTILTKTGFIE